MDAERAAHFVKELRILEKDILDLNKRIESIEQWDCLLNEELEKCDFKKGENGGIRVQSRPPFWIDKPLLSAQIYPGFFIPEICWILRSFLVFSIQYRNSLFCTSFLLRVSATQKSDLSEMFSQGPGRYVPYDYLDYRDMEDYVMSILLSFMGVGRRWGFEAPSEPANESFRSELFWLFWSAV